MTEVNEKSPSIGPTDAVIDPSNVRSSTWRTSRTPGTHAERLTGSMMRAQTASIGAAMSMVPTSFIRVLPLSTPNSPRLVSKTSWIAYTSSCHYTRRRAAYPSRVTDHRRGELYAALAAIVFGSSYAATAFAIVSFSPLAVGAWRGLLGAGLVSLLLARGGERAADRIGGASARHPLTARLSRLLVLALLGGPLFVIGMNLAVAASGATIAAFVAGLYAVIAALLGPVVLGERLSPTALAGFVVALAGTALLADLAMTGSATAGIAAGLFAALMFGSYLVLARRWSGPYRLDTRVVAATNGIVSAVALGAVALATDVPGLVPSVVRPEALVALIWLGVVLGAGQLLVVASARRIPARRSAAFLLLNPITAAILGLVLLDERLEPLQVAGGALVLTGIALATEAGDVAMRRLRQPETSRGPS